MILRLRSECPVTLAIFSHDVRVIPAMKRALGYPYVRLQVWHDRTVTQSLPKQFEELRRCIPDRLGLFPADVSASFALGKKEDSGKHDLSAAGVGAETVDVRV